MHIGTFKAYAKVNLVLCVDYPPKNGYHQVQTIFQPINLYDTLHFSWKNPSQSKPNTESSAYGEHPSRNKSNTRDKHPTDISTQDNSAVPQASSSSQIATTKMGTRVHIECIPAKYAPIPSVYLDSLNTLSCKDNLIFKAIDLLEQRFEEPFLARCSPTRCSPKISLDTQEDGALKNANDRTAENNETDTGGEAATDNEAAAGDETTADDATTASGELFISVEKAIPAGGGLGGGSSDAACAIKAYAQLHNINAIDPACIEIAQELGSDVAGFLYENATWMCGKGDTLKKELANFQLPIVLMGAAHGNSTSNIYAAFDKNPQLCPSIEKYLDAINAGNAEKPAQTPAQSASARNAEKPAQEPAQTLAQAIDTSCAQTAAQTIALACSNNLQMAACSQNEQLARNIELAKADPDVLNALVAGSGSTSFAICADEASAKRFTNKAQQFCDWACIVRGSSV